MIDLLIMAYPHVEWNDDEEYQVACVFGDIPLICFMTIPLDAFGYIEEEIENIVEHETIGLILERINPTYHGKYDLLFPHTHSFQDWRDSIRIIHQRYLSESPLPSTQSQLSENRRDSK